MVQCWELGLLISSMRLSVGFSKDSCFLVGGTWGSRRLLWDASLVAFCVLQVWGASPHKFIMVCNFKCQVCFAFVLMTWNTKPPSVCVFPTFGNCTSNFSGPGS